MATTIDYPRVSTVEPAFSIIDDRLVCTRTWQHAANPDLDTGDIVNLGGTVCRVTGKHNGARFVTYQFSPEDL